jgi:hypothetical protein
VDSRAWQLALTYNVIVTIRLASILDRGRTIRAHEQCHCQDARKEFFWHFLDGPNRDNASLRETSKDILLGGARL